MRTLLHLAGLPATGLLRFGYFGLGHSSHLQGQHRSLTSRTARSKRGYGCSTPTKDFIGELDWSGSIANLEYPGHSYFGQWFLKYDPSVRDVAYMADMNGYAAGRASANVGPVEEFTGPGNSAPDTMTPSQARHS
jgi:hypothetical protein